MGILYGAEALKENTNKKSLKPRFYAVSGSSLKNKMAGAEGFEPSARGFGDHCSTN